MLLAIGCGTDAVGVAECREIERARCAAAPACGFPDVAECQRYYRDHCLHGVAVGSPNPVEVDACVRDIERAGRCAVAQGAATAPVACAEPIATTGAAASICDVVRSPELAASCTFIRPAVTTAPAPAAPAPAAPAPAAPAPAALADAGGS